MKRSTTIIIVLLVLAIIVPAIVLHISFNSLKKSVIELAEAIQPQATTYVIAVNNPDSVARRALLIDLTTNTREENAANPVYANIATTHAGVDSYISNDTIYLNLNGEPGSDSCKVEIELPYKAGVVLHNPYPAISLLVQDAHLNALRLDNAGSVTVDDSNVGIITSIDSIATATLSITDSNVGNATLHGGNKTIELEDSNIGIIAVAGNCPKLTQNDCRIGLCLWNEATQARFYHNSGAYVTKTDPNVTVHLYGDGYEGDNDASVSSTASSDIKINDGDDNVDISPAGIKVNNEDAKVDISPRGIKVNNEDAKVDISPRGIYVRDEDGTEVEIGPKGINVKNK